MPIFLNGIKNDIFDDFIYQDVIFSLQYSKSIFAINLKGTEYGRSEKSTVLRMILRLLYIAIKVYIKVSKYLDETASVARCFIQKAREGFLIKKNPTFSQMILQTAKSTL